MTATSSSRQTWFFAAACAVFAVVVGLRFFELDGVQQEVYGDIDLVHAYVLDILAGHWPIAFVLSSGPLYHYLIAPIVWIAGDNYLAYKLSSVLVSLGVLLATWACARRLKGDWFALLAACIAGTSSWLLIFSRLGNSQIIVPLLTTASLYAVLLIVQRGRWFDYAGCAFVGGLGLYGYPQSFVLPAVLFLTLLSLRWSGHAVRWRGIGLFVVVTLLTTVPFAVWAVADSHTLVDGYIGGKLLGGGDVGATLLANVLHAFGAFHVRGDEVFRSNPAYLPHLDPLSGGLMLIGVGYWLLPKDRKYAPLLLLPFVLLQVPSVLVLSQPHEVPSASRTLAVAPICSILVASGIWWSAQAIRARSSLAATILVLAAALAIGLLNADRYFRSYLGGLPYGDTPIGRLIAEYVDTLPPATQVYIVGCCWRGGMPEPLYVGEMSQTSERLLRLSPDLTCEDVERLPRPAILIWNFDEALPGKALRSCQALLRPMLFLSPENVRVFNASPVGDAETQ